MNRARHTLALATLAVASAALVLAGCSTAEETKRDETGAITESNEKASVFDMKLGDCYNDAGTDEVETLPAVPCAESHQFEVFATEEIPGDTYPGVEDTEKKADAACTAAFEPFVGLSYDDSTLDFTYLYPTEDTWQADDRVITCLIGDPEKATTGSLKGAER